MSIIDTHIRTMTCNGPNCDKTITYNTAEEEATVRQTPWMQEAIGVHTADGRNFIYCSDVCEVESVTLGNHRKPQPKKVIPIDSNADFAIRQAAELAKKTEEATRAIKGGQPVTLS